MSDGVIIFTQGNDTYAIPVSVFEKFKLNQDDARAALAEIDNIEGDVVGQSYDRGNYNCLGELRSGYGGTAGACVRTNV